MAADPDYELFAQVAELGSISAAGRALGLSAPMASKRLARLEARLGVRLVHRTTRKVMLTNAGQRFRDDVVAILSAVREAEARLSGGAAGPSGPLRVSAPTSFGRMHIAPHLKGFLAAHPLIQLDLHLSDEFTNLIDDRIDVAVRIVATVHPSLKAHALVPNRRILCAAPSYLEEHGMPGTIADLERHKVLAAKGQSPWRLAGPEGNLTLEVKSFVGTNSSEVVRELVVAGVGIALRSMWDVSQDLESGRLVRILDQYEGAREIQIMAVHPRAPMTPPSVAAFIQFLRKLYVPAPPWEAGLPNAKGAAKASRPRA